MIENILNEAINLVDDDLVSQAYSKPPKSKGINYKKILASAAVLAMVVTALAVGAGFFGKQVIAGKEETTTQLQLYGGDGDGDRVIGNVPVSEVGYTFENGEIEGYIEKHKYDIIGAIAAEYGDYDSEYRIDTRGYYHVTLGEKNVLNLNAVTLPVSVRNKIVASVALLKNKEGIAQSISVRGEGFERLNKLLEENKETDFAFFYADGRTEVAVSPSNTVYIIKGRNIVSIDEETDCYGKFKTEKNTYSHKNLTDSENCIFVTPLPEESIVYYDEETTVTINGGYVHNATTDITLAEVLSKNISSVEWIDSYKMMTGESYRMCSESEVNDITAILSRVDFAENDSYEQKYGAAYYVKITFDDGSYATIVIIDEDFYIEAENGNSPIYTDKTGNTVSLIYYLVEM